VSRLLGQFLRFAIVGVVNTGIYYACYLPLRLVVHYVVAHVIAWVISTYGSFLLNCRFTYHVRPTVRRALIYPLSNIPNLLATTLGVVALVELAGVSQKWAPLIAGILAIPLTFLVQRALMLSPWADRPLARMVEQGSDVLAEPPTPQPREP
jgi:putative flippase GtrA